MTKKVRIENGDSSNNPLVVQVYDKVEGGDDALQATYPLNNPAEQVEVFLWKGRYLVVKEVGD